MGLLGGPPSGVLNALGSLPGRLGDLTNRLSGGILGLPCRLTGGFLDALRGLPGLLLCLARGVLGLLGDLSCGSPLLCLLGGLVHRVVESLVTGRLVEGVLDLRVGVDHLLQLRLRLRRGLLHQALELGAVVLQLTLEPAERVAVEVLGALHDLLLYLFLEVLCFAHSFSFLVIFSDAWTLSVSFRIHSTTPRQGICLSTPFAAPRKLGPCRPAPADPETANLQRSPRRR